MAGAPKGIPFSHKPPPYDNTAQYSVVILSEQSESKNLRTYQLLCRYSVRRSLDSLTLTRDDRPGGYPAAFSIFSMNIPYPVSGEFTRT